MSFRRVEQFARSHAGLLALAAFTSACVVFLALPPSAHPAGDESGNYIVVDGPQAGTTVYAQKDGVVASKDQSSYDEDTHGRIVAPGGGCGTPHFKGVVMGKKAPRGSCWRVVRVSAAQNDSGPLLDTLANAVTAEEYAADGKAVAEELFLSIDQLEQAADLLDKAAAAGGINPDKAELLKHNLERARALDEAAKAAFKAHDEDKAKSKIQSALRYKHDTVDGIPIEELKVKPPVVNPIEAVFDPALKQTVYTERATDPDDRLLTYTWTLIEHNDQSCVNFGSGTPAPNQAIWHHGDDQGCNHSLEGPTGHVGTIALVVSDRKFQCAVFYEGSQGPGGNHIGTGPDPAPCQRVGR